MKKSNFFILWSLAFFVFVSTAQSQIQWKDYPGNPIFTHGSGWDAVYIDVGSVIQDSNSRYVMWYSGSADGETPRIGRAISRDGITWQTDPLNPVLQIGSSSQWDKGAAFNPSVVVTDSGYVMYYIGSEELFADPEHNGIGRATSIDGRRWVKDSLNPVLAFSQSQEWDSNYLDAPIVIKNGTGYKMWYSGAASASPSAESSIGFATSPDGRSWTIYAQNPVFKPETSNSWDEYGIGLNEVIYDSGYYRMWYEGNIIDLLSGYMGGLGYAVSEDGINWKNYPGNPVIPSNFLSWSQSTPMNPSVIRNGNELRMWYSAFPNYIGYATSKLSPPLITIPDSLSFTRSNDTLNLIIGNWGYVPLKPLIIDSLFHINSNFTILNPPPPSTSIQPFEDIKIQILFNPTHAGSYEDTLYISSNDTSQSIKKIVLKGQSSTTDAEEILSGTPLKFNLSQNYPNPFNPSTKIDFAIPQLSFVNLAVYNILGEKVVTLINETKAPGNYEVNFSARVRSAYGGNAANLPSGIYFYKLSAGSFTESKKMILLK